MRYKMNQHRQRIKRLHKHPFIVPVITLVALFLVSAGIYLRLGRQAILEPTDAHIVILYHDNQTQTLPSRDRTVGDMLNRLHLPIHTGDVVEPALSTQIVQDNFHVNIYRAQPVTIADGEHRVVTLSAATEPRTVAAAAGVKVFPEDSIRATNPDAALLDGVVGTELIIKRAVPLTINLYGTPLSIRTHAKTVGEVLIDKHIKLAKGDNLTPSTSTPITPGMSIFVTRFGSQIVSSEQAIPAPTQYIEDASLTFGTTALRQAGVPGKQVTTYQIQTKNGVEVARTVLQVVVEQEPVPQIVARGKAVQIPADKAGVMAAAGISSSDYGYVDYIISHESGWCPTKLQGHYGGCPAYPPVSIPNGLGYGLGQATPGGKMAGFGADWQTNAVTQLRWATSYAQSRYGSWGAAYDHWQSYRYW